MSKRKIRDEHDVIWFITFSCYRWMPLISATDLYDDIYKWFDLLKQDGHAIIGYVIMPNHVHLLLYFGNRNKTINTCIAEGKRFRAYEIIKRLKKRGASQYLSEMEWIPEDHKNPSKQKYIAFEPSFDCKMCRSEKLVLLKLNYIHNNPTHKGYHLAANESDYIHSSARFYNKGTHSAYPVEHYRNYLQTSV